MWWVMPLASVVRISRMQVKTEWEREDSRFMLVVPVLLLAEPCASNRPTSCTAGKLQILGLGATKPVSGNSTVGPLLHSDQYKRDEPQKHGLQAAPHKTIPVACITLLAFMSVGNYSAAECPLRRK